MFNKITAIKGLIRSGDSTIPRKMFPAAATLSPTVVPNTNWRIRPNVKRTNCMIPQWYSIDTMKPKKKITGRIWNKRSKHVQPMKIGSKQWTYGKCKNKFFINQKIPINKFAADLRITEELIYLFPNALEYIASKLYADTKYTHEQLKKHATNHRSPLNLI